MLSPPTQAAEPAPAVQTAAPQKIVTVEGITEYRLDNGLRILLFPDPSSSKVTVNLTVLVGSRIEGYGETGMAHLLEHMLFKGTPNHPAIPKDLRDHGAQFNATTSVDRTNYFETLNATDDNLEFAIRLEVRPAHAQQRQARGPALRNDRGAQRVRARREHARSTSSASA